MKIALIGGTGYAGSALLEELVKRNYQVKAIVRQEGRIAATENIQPTVADVLNEKQLEQAFEDVDAVISAYNPGWDNPNIFNDFMQGSHNILNAAKATDVKRLLIVGGAGSLYIAPGEQLIDSPNFPKEIYNGANGARVLLDELKQEHDLNWTMISPPIAFSIHHPGTRTGQYRLGTDSPLMDGDQPGTISAPDLAVALIDELEKGQFIKERFTVAY
ncbi:NAD(P)-dependent oxidoreductase [Acinetobacter chinensis]|uniref:NAD(P)-dependent oxidoreductase n=1 Tax=Acinetobacter chinensis TaxID=2004650 RepID=UPI0029349BFB|nr:NAD(P)H-binding protein [Acinetobacter chinensis]WOE42990.1 NAD(P)H-binding protein [Acinetobacter chinensis]